VGRRVSRNDGLRQLLLEDYRRFLERWRIPGEVYERELALESGAAVVVSSSQLLRAFIHGGLPHRTLAYGGRDWAKTFALDEHDQLAEWIDGHR
jgi:hypothetical protein